MMPRSKKSYPSLCLRGCGCNCLTINRFSRLRACRCAWGKVPLLACIVDTRNFNSWSGERAVTTDNGDTTTRCGSRCGLRFIHEPRSDQTIEFDFDASSGCSFHQHHHPYIRHAQEADSTGQQRSTHSSGPSSSSRLLHHDGAAAAAVAATVAVAAARHHHR